MKMDNCKRGQRMKIALIERPEVRAQAIRFGISEGEIVHCEEIVPAGPVVLRKNNQEIAIGRRLAREIEVELIS
ncbi:MAG: ferrous iron transport protein A [Thermincola sp.]|jgi:Fe2+ transport system protein FeoA|nr:ferrous iron transport protein A [Thermincola sp.]MDT3701610.1 ferrous iron transport protein A [Thermincola sp.]